MMLASNAFAANSQDPAGVQGGQGAPQLALWYDKPAQEWLQALPVGNGRLGAMVFGGIETETYQLNEGTIWRSAVPAGLGWAAGALSFPPGPVKHTGLVPILR